MAGAILNIDIQGIEELSAGIRGYLKLFKSPGQFFAETKIIMFRDVMNHFKEESGPDGKWEPLKSSTLARRRQKGRGARILQDTGQLRGSLAGASDNTGAEVGTNKVYAARHNFGFKNITPKREFVWLSDEGGNRIVERFYFHLTQV